MSLSQHQYVKKPKTAATPERMVLIYDRCVAECYLPPHIKRTSTRQFASELGISHGTVKNILDELKMKSIKCLRVITQKTANVSSHIITFLIAFIGA